MFIARPFFPQRRIWRQEFIEQSDRFPDLSSNDILLFKKTNYIGWPANLEDLRNKVRGVMQQIVVDYLHNAFKSFEQPIFYHQEQSTFWKFYLIIHLFTIPILLFSILILYTEWLWIIHSFSSHYIV